MGGGLLPEAGGLLWLRGLPSRHCILLHTLTEMAVHTFLRVAALFTSSQYPTPNPPAVADLSHARININIIII